MNAEDLAVKTVMDYIDNLNGRQFEFYAGYFLKLIGFKNIKITQATHDFGADIIGNLSHWSISVQCKHGKDSVIGFSSIEEAVTGKEFYDLDEPMIFTNQYLTHDALCGARKCGVLTVNRSKLIILLHHIFQKEYPIKKSNIINYLFPLKIRLLPNKNSIITAKIADDSVFNFD